MESKNILYSEDALTAAQVTLDFYVSMYVLW